MVFDFDTERGAPFLAFWSAEVWSIPTKCGRSPRGIPVIIHQRCFKLQCCWLTTKLMIAPSATLNRHKDPTIKYQVYHHLLSFLSHKSEHLWPWCRFHCSHVIIWICWDNPRNSRCGHLIPMYRSCTDILAKSLTQHMLRSAIESVNLGEYHPYGKINDLAFGQPMSQRYSDSIPTRN